MANEGLTRGILEGRGRKGRGMSAMFGERGEVCHCGPGVFNRGA